MTRRHRLIYTHGAGQLGNQIIRLAHLMAWVDARGEDVEICDVGFWPYARYFDEWERFPGCVYPRRASRLDAAARLVAALPERALRFALNRHRIGRLAQGWTRRAGGQVRALDVFADERVDLEAPEFAAYVARSSLTALSGWLVQCWPLVAAREAELRARFRPNPRRLGAELAWVADLRRRHDLLIGVHLRAGDYRTWRGGRFYFPPAAYHRWATQIMELGLAKNVTFVPVSDEPVDRAVFAGLPTSFLEGPTGAVGDWTRLAGCDLVLGPPSTFSATAAFVGGGRIWPVACADQVLAKEQIIEGGLAAAARHPDFSLAVM